MSAPLPAPTPSRLARISAWNWRRQQRRLERRRAEEYRRWVGAHDTPDPAAVRDLEQQVQRQLGRPPQAQVALVRDADAAPEAWPAAPWLAFVPAQHRLAPHALAVLALATADHPDAEVIYADEDRLDGAGERVQPFFKPGFSPELLLSRCYFGPLSAYRREAAAAAWRAGARTPHARALALTSGIDGAAVVHVPRVLCHLNGTEGEDDDPAAVAAQLLSRLGVRVRVSRRASGGLHLRFEAPQPEPLVSIIVPTRDRVGLLRACVESVEAGTAHRAIEWLIVDNGSVEPATLAWLRGQATRSHVRVIRDDGDFNYSRLNNTAAAVARGEFLLLLNNDIEALPGLTDAGWLTQMLAVGALPGVGAVGARLWFPDGSLQHAGLVCGLDGVAGYAHRRLRRGHGGWMGMADLLHNPGAVTAACLLVRRSSYLAVGGLDEKAFAVAYNDVDLCLKLAARGWRTVFTPAADLVHHESSSRGSDAAPERRARFEAEFARMRERWGPMLDAHPAYNPNLALSHGAYNLAWPPRHPAPG